MTPEADRMLNPERPAERLKEKAARLEAEADRGLDGPELRARVAARRDPRYPGVLREIQAFDWPSGEPMVPDSWADILATRVMVALRREEAP
jgi:hypothetical protein